MFLSEFKGQEFSPGKGLQKFVFSFERRDFHRWGEKKPSYTTNIAVQDIIQVLEKENPVIPLSWPQTKQKTLLFNLCNTCRSSPLSFLENTDAVSWSESLLNGTGKACGCSVTHGLSRLSFDLENLPLIFPSELWALTLAMVMCGLNGSWWNYNHWQRGLSVKLGHCCKLHRNILPLYFADLSGIMSSDWY